MTQSPPSRSSLQNRPKKVWQKSSAKNKQSTRRNFLGLLAAATIGIAIGFFDNSDSNPKSSDWIMLAAFLTIVATIALLIWRHLKKIEAREIEIDYAHSAATFHHFRFITDFAGNKIRERCTIPFSQLYKTERTRGKGNSLSIEIFTAEGTVIINEFVENAEIALAFDEIVYVNQCTNPDLETLIANRPTPKTPWYIWPLLAAAILAFIYIGWAYLRTT